MATIFDLGLLDFFMPAVVFFLVLVIVWALLEKTKFFGDNHFANMLIAVCLAVLFIIIPEVRTIVALTTPWFVILFLFLFLLILSFLFMGVSPERIAGVFGGGGPVQKNLTVIWAIIIISLAIFGYAFTQVYGEQVRSITSAEDGSDLTTSIGQIIFTPKVLSMLLIIIIAGFAVRFIAGQA